MLLDTDVLVIGGGLGGAWAAIKARESGGSVLWMDKAEPGNCGQSAFAAGDVDILPEDEDIDTLTGIWMREFPLTSRTLIKECLRQSLDRVLEMEKWGISFEKDASGKLEIKPGPGGKKRALSIGHVMMSTLRNLIESKGIQVIGHTYVSDIIVAEGKVRGAVGFNIITGEEVIISSGSVVMAAGCYGLKANNFQGVGFLSGDSLAMGYRAGGELYNMEFLRGNTGHRDYNTVGMSKFTGAFGGRLRNARGEYFMQKYRPDAKIPDSAPFQEFWIAMAKEVQAGRGPIFIDLTGIKPEDYALSRKMLPHLFKVLDSAGIDIRKEIMPWIPSGYRGFGGLLHDNHFQTTINGLYVAGDAAGGVMLAWAIFTGYKAGKCAGEYAAGTTRLKIDRELTTSLLATAFAPLKRSGQITPDKVIYRIQEIMVPYKVLILKSAASIGIAQESLEKVIAEDIPRIHAADPHELMKANEAGSMALTSKIHLAAALLRTESRNFHYREDYPEQNDKDWLKWICARKESKEISFGFRPVAL
ncbi:FAD-binding protein [Chloroflexota bacterium]